MKKFLICAAVFYLGLAGCGKKQKPEELETIELVVWAHEGQPAEKKALERVFEEFNRSHKNIVVKAEFKQEQGYGDRVNAAAVAGKLPDLMEVDGPYTAHFAEAGILAPLDALLSGAVKFDFLPTIISQGTWDEKLYTVGAFESTVVIYYNLDVLERCGIRPPENIENAWTWDEFLEVLRTIKQKEKDMVPLETFMAWGGEWLSYAFSPLIWSNGGRLLSKDGKSAHGQVNGQASVAALKQWQILFTEGLTDRNAPPGQFKSGKAAMCWGIFNRWPIYSGMNLPFGMAPLPKMKDAVSPSGSWCWGITPGCKNKGAAVKVIEWLTSPEHGITSICKANGGVPSRESAVQLLPEYVRTRGLFIEQLRRTARARPSTPAYGTLTKSLSRALEDISKGADVGKALDKAAWKVEEVLKER